ncbi:catalase [Microbacterium trichothecenolyticum]|uniref:Catalase n=1 Tax=Microbacterium ureisolvens TaxID=2781186 RepID=A0ABS7HUC7_9MICO|nr:MULTISPECIES: catalase [Microbacterium]MBW9108957.1 catalase [Microbacterium ureisolvens]MBW9119919.1 catalase [Microbacterium trichothecenolyticum]
MTGTATRVPRGLDAGAGVAVRIRHSEGGGAHGYFEVTHDVSGFTRASVFQPGVRVPTLVRFSSTLGFHSSPDVWRDIRGFAVKFFTEAGEYDLVGKNSPIFFLNDDRAFSHLVVAQKLYPADGRRARFDLDRLWKFWLQHPESAHQVTWLLGDRGIPRSWRHQDGFGTHTFRWENADGEAFWVKCHFRSEQGTAHLTAEDIAELDVAEATYYRGDLRAAIDRGDHPAWRLHVQVMWEADAAAHRFNPFDITKLWPTSDVPPVPVGRLVLDSNPRDEVAEIEQAAFAPGRFVPGVGPSPDRLLHARMVGYPTFHRHRVTTPNAPAPMTDPAPEFDELALSEAARPHRDDDDFVQAGTLVRTVLDDPARQRLAVTAAQHIRPLVDPDLRLQVLDYWRRVDGTLSNQIAALA